MKPITTAPAGRVDRLDGVDLQEGERLRVRWPAGMIEEHVIHVEEIGGSLKAFIEVNHLGAKAKVYLHGLQAERVR